MVIAGLAIAVVRARRGVASRVEQVVVDLPSREISAVEESLENVDVLALADQWSREKVVQVYDPSDR